MFTNLLSGYLPEWRFESLNWDRVSEHVSHIILFSLEMSPNGQITARDRLPRPEVSIVLEKVHPSFDYSKQILTRARLAADKHGTRLLLCFGGNGRSNGFAGMTSKVCFESKKKS